MASAPPRKDSSVLLGKLLWREVLEKHLLKDSNAVHVATTSALPPPPQGLSASNKDLVSPRPALDVHPFGTCDISSLKISYSMLMPLQMKQSTWADFLLRPSTRRMGPNVQQQRQTVQCAQAPPLHEGEDQGASIANGARGRAPAAGAKASPRAQPSSRGGRQGGRQQAARALCLQLDAPRRAAMSPRPLKAGDKECWRPRGAEKGGRQRRRRRERKKKASIGVCDMSSCSVVGEGLALPQEAEGTQLLLPLPSCQEQVEGELQQQLQSWTVAAGFSLMLALPLLLLQGQVGAVEVAGTLGAQFFFVSLMLLLVLLYGLGTWAGKYVSAQNPPPAWWAGCSGSLPSRSLALRLLLCATLLVASPVSALPTKSQCNGSSSAACQERAVLVEVRMLLLLLLWLLLLQFSGWFSLGVLCFYPSLQPVNAWSLSSCIVLPDKIRILSPPLPPVDHNWSLAQSPPSLVLLVTVVVGEGRVVRARERPLQCCAAVFLCSCWRL